MLFTLNERYEANDIGITGTSLVVNFNYEHRSLLKSRYIFWDTYWCHLVIFFFNALLAVCENYHANIFWSIDRDFCESSTDTRIHGARQWQQLPLQQYWNKNAFRMASSYRFLNKSAKILESTKKLLTMGESQKS